MRSIRLFALLLIALSGSVQSAQADILELNCTGALKGAYLRSTAANGKPTDRVIAYETAKSRVSGCLISAQHTCPPGTIDAGVTDRVECTPLEAACNAERAFLSKCDFSDSGDVPANGDYGFCCVVGCKIVKSCIVPGA